MEVGQEGHGWNSETMGEKGEAVVEIVRERERERESKRKRECVCVV